MVLLKNIGIW